MYLSLFNIDRWNVDSALINIHHNIINIANWGKRNHFWTVDIMTEIASGQSLLFLHSNDNNHDVCFYSYTYYFSFIVVKLDIRYSSSTFCDIYHPIKSSKSKQKFISIADSYILLWCVKAWHTKSFHRKLSIFSSILCVPINVTYTGTQNK